MKIPSSLPLTLRTVRQEKNLRSSVLAARAGLPPQRLSDYESGIRNPTEAHLRRICPELGLSFARLVEETGWAPSPVGRPAHQTLESQALAAFAPDLPYLPPAQRDFAFRLKGARARYGPAVARFERVLDTRPDRRELETFLRDYPVDSPLEVLLVMAEASLGARPGRLAPARLGFQALPVVEPVTLLPLGHRRRPCLILEVGRHVATFMPQVAVVAGRFKPILDALAGVSTGDGPPTWTVLEADGSQHDPETDGERDEAVGLPVLRLREPDLCRPGIEQEILDWLLARHEEARAGLSRRLAAHRLQAAGSASRQPRAGLVGPGDHRPVPR